MTSNLGSDEMNYQNKRRGRGNVKDAVMQHVRSHFRPEFINRIDEVVVFHPLGAENIQSIATIQLNRLRARLLSMEMNLEFSKEAVKQIAQAGFDSIYGARPLKRAIQSEIENPLAKKILNGDFSSNDNIQIGFEKNKFTFEKI